MNLTKQIKIEDYNGETALVTIRNETRRLPAGLVKGGICEGSLEVTGFAGYYEYGGKEWPATATVKTDPRTNEKWIDVQFGFNSLKRNNATKLADCPQDLLRVVFA